MSRLAWYSLFCAVLCLLCFFSGCTSSKSSDSAGTAPVAATVPVSVATQSPTEIITVKETAPIKPTAVPVSGTATIGPSSYSGGANDPQILNLVFKKSYFNTGISNCIMKEAYPEVAKDTTYGIRQSPPKIIAISPREMLVFMSGYMMGRNEDAQPIGISRCEGVPVNPYWNFVKIDATIMPRNPTPQDYEIGYNVRSQGKVIAQYTVTETLTMNQPLKLESYIPLQSEEMAFFDSIELVFQKKAN